ncbi:MAG: hypothetical protein ABIL45_09000 [candidate division WOR-3 bacterium]
MEIIAFQRKEFNHSISKKIEKRTDFKERIKKIPILGSIAWYLYNLLKSPFRIKDLFLEIKKITDSIAELRKEVESIKTDSIAELRKEVECIKTDLSFRYTEPEDYKIINISDFLVTQQRENTKDFYVLFEKSFRNKDIELKLKKYIPFIEEAIKNTDCKGLFIDIGCGRGEFLKILKELNLRELK